MKHKITKANLIFLIPIAVLLIIWQLAGYYFQTPLFPPFSKVIQQLFLLLADGILLKSIAASFTRVIIGYILGSVAGLAVGILMGTNKLAEKSLSPIISILFPIPTLGWLPLLMLWIGINEALPITLIFICAFFPIAYNTLTGIKEVKEDYLKAARILGASRWFMLWRVILPMASPNIFTGLRMEAGMVWRTVIAAEMFAIPTGIGSLMANAESLIRVDIIMVCLIMLSLMCFLFERIFLWLEKSLTGAWR